MVPSQGWESVGTCSGGKEQTTEERPELTSLWGIHVDGEVMGSDQEVTLVGPVLQSLSLQCAE